MKLIIDSELRNVARPRVKEARLKNNMTQAAYIDRASISKLEQQKRIITDIELITISKILNVSIDWLLALNN